MSTLGLSSDIELAVTTVLQGLELPVEIDDTEDDKIKRVMDSKREHIERLYGAGTDSVDTLREALRKPIDYAAIEQTKIAEAVKAKSTILDYIRQMESGVLELKLQLEADKFNLTSREFKLGYPERFAKGEFFDAEGYHTTWHNETKDAVMICPQGTKGEIIEMDGLKIQLPKKPTDKTKILYHDLPKKEQYWRREEEPEGLNVDSEEAFSEYIYEQYRKRREGVWFMNNGKATYLTGEAWFALQHCKMKDNGGYMGFRMAQLHLFYFAKACLLDPRCLGQLFVKSRRTGYTYIILTIMLNHITSTRNINMGLTSQNDDDAKKAFKKFTYMFRNLPFYFKPVVRGAIGSEKELEFALPSDKSKSAKLSRKNKGKDYLNSYIDYQATKDGSYDGQKMYIYLGDEAGKWKKPANYENHWGRISPTFDEGGEIVGKAFIGSTVNPMKQGGEEFKKLYYQSIIQKRDPITERTPSGLYSYFLPAHKNMTSRTDKYGVCWESTPPKGTVNQKGKPIKTGTVDFLEAKRKAKKKESAIAYNEELRANPMNVLEAFRDEAKSNILPLEKITEQIEYNEVSIILDHFVTRGNFKWKDGIKDSKVEWYPDPNGRFLVSWIPPVHMQNNKRKDHKGIYHPLNSHIGCFGADTYDISGTVSGKGSKGTLSGVTGFNMGDAPSNTFFLEYINRTEISEIFFEDLLMAMVFYGMPVLAENNKPRFLYHLKNRGYRGYALNRPDRPMARLSKTEKEIGGIPSSSADVITTHASMIENFIVNFVGVYDEPDETKRVREFGSMGNMFFLETLKDWLSFDISDREKSDATISSGYALMGLHRAKLMPVPELKPINLGMTTYTQSGMTSKIKQ